MRPGSLSALAFLVAVAAPAASLQGQAIADFASNPRITVTMTRTARVPADRAVLYATVEGTAEVASDAAARAEQKAKAIETALRALGLAVDAPIAYGVAPVPVMNSYPGMTQTPQVVARMVVRAPITNLQQAAAAAAAAHGAGASSVPVTGFESSKADSVRRTLYADAVSAAQREAEALAKALNVRLGRPADASVNTGLLVPPFNYLSLFNRGFDGPQGAPDVTVTANVVIRFPISMLP